jgi:hypothetical protein
MLGLFDMHVLWRSPYRQLGVHLLADWAVGDAEVRLPAQPSATGTSRLA